jgi:hypothetical protein
VAQEVFQETSSQKETVVMRRIGRIGLLAAVGAMLAWGITHAALSKYQQKRQEILAACKAAREKMTPAEQKQFEAKCSTPEITLVSPAVIKPGETVEVTVTGKFPAGTNFIFESDGIEVLKESSAANSYRATIKVDPGRGPETLSISAYTPVCCKSANRSEAIAITGNFEWELKAANGWAVRAHAIAPAAGSRPTTELNYTLEFYRGSETAPFAKRRATLHPSASAEPPSYYFSISNQDDAAANAQDEMVSIVKQMQNPSLSEADRDKLMKRIEAMTESMTKEAQKMTDPNYFKQLQAKEQEFGCTAINLKVQAGAATGNMRCSEKVGQDIKLNGTMKMLAK